MSEKKSEPHLVKARARRFAVPPAEPEVPAELNQSLVELSQLPDQVRSSAQFDTEIEPTSIDAGRRFLIRLWRLVAQEEMRWHPPHLGTEDKGDVEFGWWRGKKTFLISVTAQNVHYLRAWGSSIQNEMDEGQDPSDTDLINLWHWLLN